VKKILEIQLIDEKTRKLPAAKAPRISQFITFLDFAPAITQCLIDYEHGIHIK
jgi:hypothetical protein